MGGYGSGRYGGRPTADSSLRIDLAWMFRTGRIKEACDISGSLHWSCGGSPRGSIGYRALMSEPGQERLALKYTRGTGEDAEQVLQSVYLSYTTPNFGGRRWWMICPYRGTRVGKLYLPPGGDRFASRQAWNLGYQSQRIAKRDRPFDALFRLQRKLGCDQGWGNWISRPKGMHHRTFNRYLSDFEYLDDLCSVEMMKVVGILGK